MPPRSLREEALENVRLAFPIALTQLGTMAMGLVDTAIVGRVGERELAGVALGNTLVMATMMPGIGMLTAIEPMASQALGAGDRTRARIALREGVRLALLVTLPTTLLCWASLALLPLLRVDPTAIPGARAYVLARLPGMLPIYVYLAIKTWQQAMLRPRAAVEAMIVANVVHAAVAWLAVMRLGLGAGGAGVATSASSIVLAAWVWVSLRRDPPPEQTRHRTDWTALRKLARLGFPAGVQLAAEVGIFALVALLMGRLGGRAAAAHQVAIGLASFSFMGALGVAMATSVRVGIAVGERAPRGARRAGGVGIVLGLLSMAGWSIAFGVFPTALARIFTPESPLIEAAATLLRIAAVFQLADGMQVVAAGALRGAGDTRFPLAINVVAHWGIGLPLALLLAFRLGYGAPGLWWALTVALGLVASALLARFLWSTRRDPAPL